MLLHRPVRPPIAMHATVEVDKGRVAVGEGVVPDAVQTTAFGHRKREHDVDF